jgi:hypothetical protein
VGGLLTFEVLGVVVAMGGFEITVVGNNENGNPMVSPGRISVEMYGGPKFQKERKVKGSSGQGVPPLVFPGVDAINTDSN